MNQIINSLVQSHAGNWFRCIKNQLVSPTAVMLQKILNCNAGYSVNIRISRCLRKFTLQNAASSKNFVIQIQFALLVKSHNAQRSLLFRNTSKSEQHIWSNPYMCVFISKSIAGRIYKLLIFGCSKRDAGNIKILHYGVSLIVKSSIAITR